MKKMIALATLLLVGGALVAANAFADGSGCSGKSHPIKKMTQSNGSEKSTG